MNWNDKRNFQFFGTLVDSIEQLKINESAKNIDGIAYLIKQGSMFSGVLMILSLR